MDQRILKNQIRFYNYFIKTIDAYLEHSTPQPLKQLIIHLNLLGSKSKYLFDEPTELELLQQGYINNSSIILLYLKYKFLFFINQHSQS